MLKLLRKPKRVSPIGLDVGATGVRAAQVAREGNRLVVRAAAAFSYRPGAAPASVSEEARRELIRRVMSQGAFQGRSIITMPRADALSFHPVRLPESLLAAAGPDVHQALVFEVQRSSDTESGSLVARHWPTPDTPAHPENALAVAAAERDVHVALDDARSAKLECLCVDSYATALSRFVAATSPPDLNRIVGVLDVGSSQSRLALLVDDCPVLVRRAGSGACDWTRRISESLGIGIEAAETQKRACGIDAPTPGRRKTDAPGVDPLAGVLHRALRDELTDLIEEIKRSFEYVISCHPGRELGGLVLAGRGARTPGLVDCLGRELGIEVRSASQHAALAPDRFACGGAWARQMETIAVAVGLALGGMS